MSERARLPPRHMRAFAAFSGGAPPICSVRASVMVALAKVVLLTKDERDMIGDFLAYYGALFGPENLVVVDNASTDPTVLATYERAARAGVSVVHEPRPFRQAAAFMTEHIARVCAAGDCEWVLPLETDEFVVPSRSVGGVGSSSSGSANDAAAWSVEEVHAALRAVPEDVTLLRYSAFLGSSVDPTEPAYRGGGLGYARPAADITRFHDQGWDKLIVRASAFVSMTQWCHHAQMSRGRAGTAELSILHFHDAGLRRTVARAKPVVHSYMFDVVHRTLREQLDVATELVARGNLACGHKLIQYHAHLRRLATLRAFRRHLGRMPASVDEMEQYAGAAGPRDPAAAVRRDAVEGRLARADAHGSPTPAFGRLSADQITPMRGTAPRTWDELLYHEPRMAYAFECRFVQQALKIYSKHHE